IEQDMPNMAMRFIYNRAFGTSPDDLAAASPALQIGTNNTIPPFFIAYVDRERAPEAATGLATALTDAGNRATLYQAPAGYTHSSIMTELGADQDVVGPAVLNFLQALAPGQ
ncbi:MAG: hypothetical protein AAF556_04200, partial [Pseudomonadota bacterium]